MQDRDHLKKQMLADLIRQTASAPPVTPEPSATWVQGSHNIVINGGSVAIHMAANACPLYKEGAHD